jgi:RNA polymerase sigma-70 factor (ECF subfamily)
MCRRGGKVLGSKNSLSASPGEVVYQVEIMPESDAQLLTAFARRRDEAAFRALAGRHLGLVFHAALRRTGSRPLAEEISQNVLCALAAKAGSLARHPERLPAWLHRATHYESTKAMRSEAARRRREQLAEAPGPAAPEPAVADALPHLDPALDRLGEADRRLLLLHYYEGRSFPEVAGLLGKSTAAVQKQSQRALEKLARILRGKGVALSAAGLASVMSAEFAKAAPHSLASSVATSTLSGGGGASPGLAIYMTMKSKALVPAVLLVAAIPLALQEAAISRAERRLHAVLPGAAAVPSLDRLPRRGTTALSSLSNSLDLMVLIDEQMTARLGGQTGLDDFSDKLASIGPEDLVRLIREAATCDVRLDQRGDLLESLVAALGKTDPGLAVVTSVDALPADINFEHFIESAKVHEMLGTWAWKDGEAAWRWFERQAASGKLKWPFARGRTGFSNLEMNLTSRLLAPLIVAGVAGGGELMARFQSGSRGAVLTMAIDHGFRGAEADPAGRAAIFVDVLRDHAMERERPMILRRLAAKVGGRGGQDLEQVSRLFEQVDLSEQEREVMAGAIVSSRMQSIPWDYDRDTESLEIQTVSRWIFEEVPEAAEGIVSQAVADRERRYRRQAESSLAMIDRWDVATDQSLARVLNGRFPGELLDQAIKRAERIQDPALKIETLRKLRLQAEEPGTTTNGP